MRVTVLWFLVACNRHSTPPHDEPAPIVAPRAVTPLPPLALAAGARIVLGDGPRHDAAIVGLAVSADGTRRPATRPH